MHIFGGVKVSKETSVNCGLSKESTRDIHTDGKYNLVIWFVLIN